jgi:hypothetical protein
MNIHFTSDINININLIFSTYFKLYFSLLIIFYEISWMFSDWLNKTPGSKKAGAIPFLKKGRTRS